MFARALSALKDERVAASAVLNGPAPVAIADKAAFIADLEEAVYASKIVSYTQGYMLMRAAAKEYGCEGDLAAGANIAGFLKVADAMMAQGAV